MDKHVGIRALKKSFQIEPFFSGTDDKRSDRVEVLLEQGLLLCSFKRRTRDVKIVDLKSAHIRQSIPPVIKFAASTKDQDLDDNTFLKATQSRADDEDDRARDHVLTFTVRPSQQTDGNVRVVTAHSSGLLKEWIVSREKSSDSAKLCDGDDEDEVRVVMKRNWQSFHKSPISLLKFSDASLGSYVASGGTSDSTIKVWDLERAMQTHNYKLVAGVVTVILFHSVRQANNSKHYLFTSGELDTKIQVFDMHTNQKQILDGHISAVTSVLVTNDKTLVSASRDKLIIFWDLQNMSAIRKIPVFESIEDMILFPISGKDMLITAGDEGKIKMIDPATGRLVNTFEASSSKTQQSSKLKQIITAGDSLISVSFENHLNFHHISGSVMKTDRQLVGEMDQVLSVKFVGGRNEHLVVASNSPVLKIYSLSKERNSCHVVHGHTDIILSVQVFSYDRDLFVTGSKDNSIRIWRFFQKDDNFGAFCLCLGSGHFRSVTSVAVPSRSSSGFILSGSEESIVKLWKLPHFVHETEIDASKEIAPMSSLASVRAHDKDVNSISISPNDMLLATGSKDKTCKIWSIDHKTKQVTSMATLRGHRKTIWCTDFSPVDKIVLTASGDCSIKIWSLADYSCLRTFSVNNSSVYLFAKFISNGSQIASSSSDSLVKVWSLKTTEPVITLDPLLHSEIISDVTLNKFKSVKSKVANGENPEDEEEDDLRIWTLDLDVNEKFLTFGSGSRVFMYQDNTQEAENQIISLRDDQVVTDQKLHNLLHQGKYEKALRVAINLDQPYRCLEILRQITLSTDSPTNVRSAHYDVSDDDDDGNQIAYGLQRLHNVLSQMRNDQLLYLMKHASFRWNTNSRNCWLAQVIMKTCLPKLIRELNDKDFDQDLSQIQSMIEAMISYSERHYARIKKLGVSSHFVHFVAQNVMKSLPVQDLSLNDEPDSGMESCSGTAPTEPMIEMRQASECVPEKTVLAPAEADEDEILSSGEETQSADTRKIIGAGDSRRKNHKKKKTRKPFPGNKQANTKTGNRIGISLTPFTRNVKNSANSNMNSKI